MINDGGHAAQRAIVPCDGKQGFNIGRVGQSSLGCGNTQDRGCAISADWLPGLKTDEKVKRYFTRDHGLACMAVASKLPADLRAAHERDPDSMVTTDRVEQPDGELAVSLMPNVLTALETISDKMPPAGRAALFSGVVRDADPLERLIRRRLGSH